MKKYWKLIVFSLSVLVVLVVWLTYGFGHSNEAQQWPVGEETYHVVFTGNTYFLLALAVISIFVVFLVRAKRK